jgi:hypothetical protein
MNDGDGNGGTAKSPIMDKVHHVADRAKDLAGQGKAVASGASDAVIEHTRENPYAALAAAFGVGYVLGGGLFSNTTVRLLGLGVKLATVPLVQNMLLDVAEVALDSALAQGRKIQPEPQPAAAAPSSTGAPRA